MLDTKGKNLGLDQSSLKHGYLPIYELIFSDMSVDEKIIVIGDSELALQESRLLAECYPNTKVILLSNQRENERKENFQIIHYSDIEDAIFSLMAIGKIDWIIEHSDNARKNKTALFSSLFPFVKSSGSYFIEDIHSCWIDYFNDGTPSIFDLLNQFIKNRATGLDKNPFPVAFPSQLIDSIEYYGKLARIKRSNFAILGKIQAATADKVFSKLDGSFVEHYQIVKQKQQFDSTAKLIASKAGFRFMSNLSPKINVPEIALRTYQNVICLPGQLPVKDGLLLPEHQRRTVSVGHTNCHLKFSTPYYAHDHLNITNTPPKEQLRGSYLYLDNEYDSHFGHVLTEFISKLWAWEIFNTQHPDGKVLVGAVHGKPYPLVLEILKAYGIPEDKIVAIDKPLSVERLVCPSQQYQIGYYISPDIELTWEKLKAYFLKQAQAISELETPEKIFISRKENNRACRNITDVEYLFRQAGYTIIYPEDYPFAQQVALFHHARAIAGFGGSATLNAIFSQKHIPKIIIQSDTYTANNDYLISSVKGGSLHICYCRADLQYQNHWDVNVFMSPYFFNLDTDTAFIETAIKASQ